MVYIKLIRYLKKILKLFNIVTKVESTYLGY